MRYNKGVFILLLTLLLALLITACGGTSAPSAGDSAAEAVQSASV